MYKLRAFNDIIKEICKEKDIEYQELSDDWIIKLKKNNKIRFIVGYKFDLNTQALSEICNDKYALYTVLSSENLPIIESQILFKNEEQNLEKYFDLYGKNVVIKPNNGTCGNNVIHAKNLEELKLAYEKILQRNNSVVICPFYNILSEYRVIYLRNKKYIYKKVKPQVIGDGIHNINELLKKFNEFYYKNPEHLKNDMFDLNYIPYEGEIIEYEWRFNLSKGAKIEKTSDYENEILSKMADKIAEILDLKFVSIDIIKNSDNKFMVMEINSGVMTENLIKQSNNGKEIAKEIYSEAINQMFII